MENKELEKKLEQIIGMSNAQQTSTTSPEKNSDGKSDFKVDFKSQQKVAAENLEKES